MASRLQIVFKQKLLQQMA